MQSSLQGLLHEVRANPHYAAAVQRLVADVCRVMDVAVCSLYRLNRETQLLQLHTSQGAGDVDKEGDGFQVTERLEGEVARREQAINVEDAVDYAQSTQLSGTSYVQYPVFLGVPIIHHRQVLGVLTVQRATRRFTNDEEGFLVSLATGIAAVVAHAEATSELELFNSEAPDQKYVGGPGSPGIATGTAVLIDPPTLTDVPYRAAEDIEQELQNLDVAVRRVREDLNRVAKSMESQLQAEELLVFRAYEHMLDDGALPSEIRTEIRAGQWAQGALRQVISKHESTYERSEDAYIKERASDFRELGQRLLMRLRSMEETVIEPYPADAILIGEEITAGILAELKDERVKGVVSQLGSTNSHTAILSRSLNIPAAMGVLDIPLYAIQGRQLIIDGYYGEVVVNPSATTVQQYEAIRAAGQEFARELDTTRNEPSETSDGHRINLWANIGLVAEITGSLDRGAEGIGLFRTETPFANAHRFPTEDEQYEIYRQHMEAFDPRPVTMRLLDIGGDKVLPYFPIAEDDPFLGWRGIRVLLDQPEILLTQVRAMIKANAGLEGILRIMMPMVSTMAEIREAKSLIDRAFNEVLTEGIVVKRPELGVMIEVPAMIYQARQVARMVDFLAVGSNDMTQYMLAASRNNPRVANVYQEFHPSVIRALRELAKAAHSERKGIGICGELAGTPEGAVLCIGMGYDVLSMNATNIPLVKWIVRKMTMRNCRRILSRVLRMDDAQAIIYYIHEQLEGLGLSKAIPRHEPHELVM